MRHRRIRIRRSRVLGEDARPKTGRSKRDLIAHEGLERVLRGHMPRRPAPEDFVFTTPRGTPIDEVNFYQREWLAALRALRIRPRPFYNCRHTYISTLLAAGGEAAFRLPPDGHEPRDDRGTLRRRTRGRRAPRRDDR
ncbi:MAG: hypothetical protein E6J71_02825 [Deltaproteobacteria bacterium]|nr:MAG: hypothetical protein E6J71_02825 [Deltaproteobacteria bacterium]